MTRLGVCWFRVRSQRTRSTWFCCLRGSLDWVRMCRYLRRYEWSLHLCATITIWPGRSRKGSHLFPSLQWSTQLLWSMSERRTPWVRLETSERMRSRWWRGEGSSRDNPSVDRVSRTLPAGSSCWNSWRGRRSKERGQYILYSRTTLVEASVLWCLALLHIRVSVSPHQSRR